MCGYCRCVVDGGGAVPWWFAPWRAVVASEGEAAELAITNMLQFEKGDNSGRWYDDSNGAQDDRGPKCDEWQQ